MIFAKNMKENADIANEKKQKHLDEVLWNVYYNIIVETEKLIEEASNRGKYSVKTPDLQEKLDLGVGRRLVDDGYSSFDVKNHLANMIVKQLQTQGFSCEVCDHPDCCLLVEWYNVVE